MIEEEQQNAQLSPEKQIIREQVHIGLVEKMAELLHEIFYCTCCPIRCKPIATVFCRMFRSSGFHVYHYIEIERDACAKIQIDRASVR
jgi:hypothetical protein